jgi:outer membrane protein TolC
MKLLTVVSFVFFCSFSCSFIHAQDISLEDCFRIAQKQNTVVNQTRVSLSAKQFNLAAERQNYLPKLDVLASYSYLSKPLELDLQYVRNGIVQGTANQAVSTANSVYQQITGNQLPQAVQTNIFNSSKTIINGLYPDYNPTISKQSFVAAGFFLRQPLFLGNKLTAARNFAESQVATGRIGVDVAEKDVDYAIAVEYIRILYLNSMMQTQNDIIGSLDLNNNYAEQMVKEQILAPYQKSWTKVILLQAKTNLGLLQTDKKNAFIELKKLLGISPDSALSVNGLLNYKTADIPGNEGNFWEHNPSYLLVQSNISTAKTSEKITHSFSLPNIFAVGNYNLFHSELPVTTPPWMVGAELQWNLFNGTQTKDRKRAAAKLIEESQLAEQNTRESLQAQLAITKNTIADAQNQLSTIDSARKEIANTRDLVNERVKNQLSSLKDLNDVILQQAEIEKTYLTALLAYFNALATYWNITGTPNRISDIIK